MTIRQDMLGAVSRAKGVLGGSAELVVRFLQSQINQDGGFKGRDGRSDLYYTMFGAEAMKALGADVPRERIAEYLAGFCDAESLDLVHLGCLVRCMVDLGRSISDSFRNAVLQRVAAHRSADGGFSTAVRAACGSAYGCFFALGLYQDMKTDVPAPDALVKCIESLETRDGGYANEHSLPVGMTAATAAALSTLHYLDRRREEDAVDWLIKQLRPDGGWPAAANAPLSDLLSTATALHTLGLLEMSLINIREQCLDFVESLWDGKGGFFGCAADRVADCEYTYYALLALGHLREEK